VTADDARAFLIQRQIKFNEVEIPFGTSFRCVGGEILNVYTSGKVTVQGRATPFRDELLRWSVGGEGPLAAATTEAKSEEVRAAAALNNQVFIVYGHDNAARDSLELLLRRMGLDPIVLAHLRAGGDTIIEKLEQHLGASAQTGYACVILTPDDEGYVAGRAEEKKYRARQNVVLELGMVLARLGRRRVAILHKESVELPSDIAGLIYIAFKERIEELAGKLYDELEQAGYRPKRTGL
jgi:predicted nucleotide-binding protein